MKKKGIILALLMGAVMFAMTACGDKQPVSVFNPQEDYDGFEKLAEQDLEGTGDIDKIMLFVPAENTSHHSTYVTGSSSDVNANISLVNSNTIKANDKDPEKILSEMSYIDSDYFSGAEKKASEIKTAQDGKAAYILDYEIYKYGSETLQGYCKTDFVLKLDDDNFIYGKVNISMTHVDKYDKDIKAIVKEMDQYYCVKIYYDKDKVIKRMDAIKGGETS